MRRLPPEHARELRARQPRILRAPGLGRIVARRDIAHFGVRATKRLACVEDVTGKAAPVGLALARQVIDAEGGEIPVGSQPRRRMQDRVGDVERGCRIAPLIGDDRDLVAVTGQPQHRLDEVLAEGAVDPGRAQDEVARVGRRHGRFAGELGGAVDAERRGRVGFDIGAVPGAVEDIVGRQVDDGNAEPRRGFGHLAGAGRVHREG